MNIISSSCGNDSVALMQWSIDNGLPDLHVVFCDTGWAAPGWLQRVDRIHRKAERLGIKTHKVAGIGMPDLVRIKKGFPGNGQQFCTAHLKGLPFLEWLDANDPDHKAVVLIAKRREESEARKDTPEFIEASEYHDLRKVWHPLYMMSAEQRNKLVEKFGENVLPNRSGECSPCVNANRADFLRLTPGEVERVSDLEVEVSQPMFRAKRFGALGIHGVMAWAKDGRDRGSIENEEAECSSLFGCGL